MKNIGSCFLALFGLIFVSACSLSKLGDMTSLESMQDMWTGANQAQETLETYGQVKDAVRTAEEVYDVIDTVIPAVTVPATNAAE